MPDWAQSSQLATRLRLSGKRTQSNPTQLSQNVPWWLTMADPVPNEPMRHYETNPLRAAHKKTADRTGVRPTARKERSEEHTSELQSPCNLVCRLLLEKKKKKN